MATPFDAGDQKLMGVVVADNVTLTLKGSSVLVQQFQFTCTRTVNMMYEIGSSDVYYVGNRRAGQGTLNRVAAGGESYVTLLTTYGKMCAPEKMTLSCTPCKGGGKVTYECKDATLTAIGATVTAADIIITENLTFIFSDIDIS